MEPIELLRRLLDERGVEYTQANATGGTLFIVVTSKEYYFILVRDNNAGIEMWSQDLTPEQVIEATLGPLTERAAKDSEKDSDGCGECHDTHESRWFHCSECGFGMTDLYTDEPWTEEGQPKHCPNCGCMVVSE